MINLVRTDVFQRWIDALRDLRAFAKIMTRLDRLSEGHKGDVKPVGAGVLEARINYGPGYRIYFVRRGQTVVVLLCGGDKSTQSRDIRRALELATNWKE